jgi:uncharacterized membrane protein YgdD (TMEM256/DUF423 family)
MTRRAALLVASLTGFLAIGLGAFGAHALKLQLDANHARDLWNTAVLYHLVHAPVLLWLARGTAIATAPYLCFAIGILLFSGSLYALALTGIGILVAITPLGGLLLMAGWILIGLGGLRAES